jgi:surfactin synthase thioesterase subunit
VSPVQAIRGTGRPSSPRSGGPGRTGVTAGAAARTGHSGPPIHDAEFLDAVDAQYGALPPELRADPELLALVLPYHRADFQVYEQYRHVPGEPLRQPVTVVGGRDDVIPPERLVEWERHCAGDFQLRLVPGGHFYWRDEHARRQLADILDGRAG